MSIMKLSNKFCVKTINGATVLIDITGEWQGMARCNRTMSLVIDMLKVGTTKEQIQEKLCCRYDGDASEIKADLERVLVILEEIGALEGSDEFFR